MKFFLLFNLTIFTFISNPTFGKEKESIFVLINGLVCDFCAQSIEKTFNKKQAVKSLNINLEKMLITINLKEGFDLENEMIIDLITNSGYDVVEINREK